MIWKRVINREGAWILLLSLLLLGGGGVIAGAQRAAVPVSPVIGSWDLDRETAFQLVSGWDPLAAIQEADDPTIMEHAVVVLTNLARVEEGLPPLKLNEALREAARGHARDMAENDFFNHIGSDGSTLVDRINRVNYPNWLYAAENIAAGFPTPDGVVQAWLNSPSHRVNIMHPDLKEIGVGYAYDPDDQANVRLWDGSIGGPYYHYWVQDFGTRLLSYPVIINLEAYSTETPEVTLYIHGEGWAQQMKISNYPDFRDAQWQPFQSVVTWRLLPGEGTRTVYVRLRDAIGFVVESSDSIELIPPAAPDPSTYGLEINGGARYTNQRTLNVRVRAPEGTVAMRLGFTQELASRPWEPYEPEVQLTIPEEREGLVTLYGQIRLDTGWESPVFQGTIAVDTSPPTGMAIIREREPGRLKLLIAAEDAISGVAEMQLGFDPQLRDAPWRPFDPAPELVITSGAGDAQTATAYVRLRDKAGNRSPIYAAVEMALDYQVLVPLVRR